jgi:hypothetical protein
MWLSALPMVGQRLAYGKAAGCKSTHMALVIRCQEVCSDIFFKSSILTELTQTLVVMKVSSIGHFYFF